MKENSKVSVAEKNENLATARLRYLRIAPRKVRLVANLIKKMPANQALAQLSLSPRRAAEPLLKLLKSAIENAKSKNLKVERLVVKEIKVDKGPILKRWMPRAQGRATPIHKITSHVFIALTEAEKELEPKFVIETKKPAKKKEKASSEKAEHQAQESEKKKEEKKLEIREEKLKGEQKKDQKGFLKRMFRRKSI
ncbi:MAG: hypothetical protein KatS3mg098_366 [Candidatus Parcubacteria bacterium]|nr:MAG: hypothetical protein KatS3mg098_366 [Candidatus Parcubacteria bacterium]